jgi:hypothetical protein
MTSNDGMRRKVPEPGAPVQRSWQPGARLTRLEDDMLCMAKVGELLDVFGGPADLAAMKAWGPRQTIRAAVLRHLLVDAEWPVHAKGVRLRGVRISGHLDLEVATLRCPLRLEDCYLSSSRPVNLNYATVSLLTFRNCVLAGLMGNTLVVTRELDLAGSVLTGPLLLDGADITGWLSCTNTQLTGADRYGNALGAWRIKVGGSFFLNGFTAAGTVWLLGAHITGDLRCTGAQLTGADGDGYGLRADGMQVGGNVLLNDGFTAAGAVRIYSAEITGRLDCSDARLTGADGDGNALNAWGIKVGGDVLLNGLTAIGAVRLAGAEITGLLSCSGAQLTASAHGNGHALIGWRMKVGGDVFLDEEFTSAGVMSLRSARIGRSLLLRSAKLAQDKDAAALDLTGAQITQELRWAPREAVVGHVVLEDAQVGQLADDWTQASGPANGFWPPADQGRLHLGGFTYTRISGDHQAGLEQRLAWIGSPRKHAAAGTKPAFDTQPYEQLAKVYQQAGQDAEARKVAIARRQDLRRYGDLSRSRKAGNWLLDITIRYGYQTWRAVAGLAAVYVVVLIVFWLAQHRTDLIVPAQASVGLHPAPAATSCTSRYPCFSPAGYAIDTVIPLINVHQAEYWRPNASAPGGWFLVYVTWTGIGLGWALTTLIVAGYTGLVRSIDTR